MFDSKAVLWEKGGPLATVWIAASLGKCKSFRVKLTRRDYCRTDVVEVCSILMTPDVKLTLGLTSHLLLGIVRIHHKQTQYALREFEGLLKHFDFISRKFSITLLEEPRPAAVTIPEVFDTSFSSLHDISFSHLETLAGYVRFNGDTVSYLNEGRVPHLPDQPTSPSSLLSSPSYSTPPPFTADPKDISLAEHPERVSVLDESLIDTMYFGDEDPHLIADMKKTGTADLLSPTPSGQPDSAHPQGEEGEKEKEKLDQDQVLLYNEETGELEFCNTSSSTTRGSPDRSDREEREGGLLEDTAQAPFEMHAPATPTHPASSPRQQEGEGQVEERDKLKVVKRRRKRKPRQVLDTQVEIGPRLFKEGLRDKGVGIQKPDYTKQFKKRAKAADLLYEPFSNSVKNHVLAATVKPHLPLSPEEVEKNRARKPDDGPSCATPLISKRMVTPTSTPMVFVGEEGQKHTLMPDLSAIKPRPRAAVEESDALSGLSMEVLRQGERYAMSYEDPLRVTGLSTNLLSAIDSSQSHGNSISLHGTSRRRLNCDPSLVGREGRPELTMVGLLPPIADVELEEDECMDITALNVGGEDIISGSFDLPRPSPQGKIVPTSSSSSPFIESKAVSYCGHVATVMGGRSQVEFLELLPPGATRKTASIAFSHVLTLVTTHRFLTLKQTLPYGPIILSRGERF